MKFTLFVISLTLLGCVSVEKPEPSMQSKTVGTSAPATGAILAAIAIYGIVL